MKVDSTGEDHRRPVGSETGPAGARDHVDLVLDQWRAVRPELDTSPVAIVARIGRIANLFDQSIGALMAGHGLSRSSWDVLASLRRVGPPYQLSPTELYQALMRSSGAMTNRLHRLEEAGLIERRPDPGDGRGRLVRLRPRGRKLVDKVASGHLENENRLLGGLTEAERRELGKVLRKLALFLEQGVSSQPRPNRRRRS